MTRIPLSVLLSAIAVFGTVLAAAGMWLGDGAFEPLILPALVAVYLAGGLPASWRALETFWRDRVLDIDLLMVVAAVAAAK